MKRIIFLTAIMLLLIGCTEVQVEEEQVTTPTEGYEMMQISGNTESTPTEYDYTIRLTEHGPDLDYIEANVNDIIRLEVINDIEGPTRFMIEFYGPDVIIQRLGFADVTLVLAEAGTFTYGDDTTTIPKGTLVVN